MAKKKKIRSLNQGCVVEVEIPNDLFLWLLKVSTLAGVDMDTTVNVILAMELTPYKSSKTSARTSRKKTPRRSPRT